MNAYELPRALEIGGKSYPIRYQYGAVLDILAACNDPDLDREEMTEIMLRILYPDYDSIPPEHIPEACEKACLFIDCGEKRKDLPGPKLFDWQQDARIIVPAINSVAGKEVRENPELHWWTFRGYFMEIRDSLFSCVLRIRSKQAKGEKLEKAEERFYRENKELVDLQTQKSREERAIEESILKWL